MTDTRCWGYIAADNADGFKSQMFASAKDRAAAGWVDTPAAFIEAKRNPPPTATPAPPAAATPPAPAAKHPAERAALANAKV